MPAPACKHWRECGIIGGGCCAINAYKRPSFGVCAICTKRQEPMTPARIVHGAAGITKAVTGTGGASPDTIKDRLAICQTCEYAEIVAGLFRLCRVCGCSTWAKVRNANERCPKGKW